MKRLLFFLCVVPTVFSLSCDDSAVFSNQVFVSDSEAVVYGDKFPEVLAVTATLVKGDAWRFEVTLSSPYDTPKRYADAWRVLDGEDQQLGIRVLGHDHANEQPFTRSQTVKVPSATQTVFVEGRDQANGWSGQRFEVKLSRD